MKLIFERSDLLPIAERAIREIERHRREEVRKLDLEFSKEKAEHDAMSWLKRLFASVPQDPRQSRGFVSSPVSLATKTAGKWLLVAKAIVDSAAGGTAKIQLSREEFDGLLSWGAGALAEAGDEEETKS